MLILLERASFLSKGAWTCRTRSSSVLQNEANTHGDRVHRKPPGCVVPIIMTERSGRLIREQRLEHRMLQPDLAAKTRRDLSADPRLRQGANRPGASKAAAHGCCWLQRKWLHAPQR